MGTAGQSVTLANSIIGVGILAMPFCFQRCGVLLATLTLLSMGLISRLCCYFLLKSALLARRRNFEFLAFHVFGPAGKFAVELGIIGFLMGTCIAYFVVVGDLGPQIIAKMLNINQSDILRTSIMVIISLVCVLPLGLLRNVDSLSNVSAATICFYFCLVMKVITEAASQLFTGDWHTRVEMWTPSGLLQCVPIFSMALFCQTQLFEIFESLPTLSLEKMNLVTKNAINICTGVYFTLGLFGYIAFSSQDISGNILVSLSPTMASDVIKLGFVMSLAFSFPLIIFPCRASLYSLLYRKVHSSHHDHLINHSIPERTFRCMTVGIVAVALVTSLLVPNIELVLGLVGATIGALVCVVFPAACFVNLTFKNTNERVLAKSILFSVTASFKINWRIFSYPPRKEGSIPDLIVKVIYIAINSILVNKFWHQPVADKIDNNFEKAAVVLGLIIMVLGTYANLQAAEVKIDRYDDRSITQERIDKMVEDFFQKQGKQDGERVKPISKDNNLNMEKLEIENNIIKDSEMQPPNPVPPDASNEKSQKIHIEDSKDDKTGDMLPDEKEQIAILTELHPKDVKTKLNEAKQVDNGASSDKKKFDQDPKTSSNEDKIHIKQQQLIETIKQHGEEQKELMKEQKEILDEIIKTKKELQETKNEVDSKEAKKIAVESIKQIANMAIQSIGGVTEKPNKDTDLNSDHLEKLTNEAVQEIAKKAVETIEAIQEIKGNPDKPVIKSESTDLNANKIINSNSNEIVNSHDTKENGSNVLKTPNNNIAKPNLEQQKSIKNNKILENNLDLSNKELVKKSLQGAVNTNDEQLHHVNMEKDKPSLTKEDVKQTVIKNPVINDINVKDSDKTQPQKVTALNQSAVKPLPISQADSQKIPEIKANGVVPNLPIPLAANNVEVKNQIVNEQALKKPEAIATKLANIINNNVEANIPLDRQKRDVLDCTFQAGLRADEKEICENKQINNDLLPKIDLNEALSKRVPAADAIHLGRSLKSFDMNDENR